MHSQTWHETQKTPQFLVCAKKQAWMQMSVQSEVLKLCTRGMWKSTPILLGPSKKTCATILYTLLTWSELHKHLLSSFPVTMHVPLGKNMNMCIFILKVKPRFNRWSVAKYRDSFSNLPENYLHTLLVWRCTVLACMRAPFSCEMPKTLIDISMVSLPNY